MTTCKNCDNQFEGKFCPNCAQKADTHRLTVKHFAHEFFHAFTHTDKGILFLMKELILRPGRTIRDYNEGRRKKYFNPITFLLIASALQLFATKKTHIFEHYMTSLEVVTSQLAPNKQVGEEIRKSVKQQTEKPLAFTMEYSKLLTFLFIPILGFFTWLLFKKSGFNYAENLVLNVMISAELSILFLALCVVPFLIMPSLVILWMTLFMLINWVYSIIVYKRFFQQSWLMSILKGMLVQIAFMLCIQVVVKVTVDLLFS
jgi:hypothetical protein